jgi:uncharacterized protein YoxC
MNISFALPSFSDVLDAKFLDVAFTESQLTITAIAVAALAIIAAAFVYIYKTFFAEPTSTVDVQKKAIEVGEDLVKNLKDTNDLVDKKLREAAVEAKDNLELAQKALRSKLNEKEALIDPKIDPKVEILGPIESKITELTDALKKAYQAAASASEALKKAIEEKNKKAATV